MRTLLPIAILFFLVDLLAQNPVPVPTDLEVEGNARISEMETILNGEDNVVLDNEGKLAIRSYKVGDLVQGGIIFYVDKSGEHGLVCSLQELGPLRWFAGTNGKTRATSNGIFAGEMNTALIIAGQLALGDDGADYAAQICDQYKVAIGSIQIGDWYLPSTDELKLIYNRINDIQEITLANGGDAFSSFYWSSEEEDQDSAFGLDFTNGGQQAQLKSTSSAVRAVRSF